METTRNFILQVWRLAEEVVVQEGKPLHGFLLLHHILTQPPHVLRRTIQNRGVGSPTSSPPNPTVTVPLHSVAFDAEWKCEELATRLRAVEYILFPGVGAVQSRTGASSPALSSRPPAALSRVAGLEVLEMAEEVLAPVFATSSFPEPTDWAQDGPSPQRHSIRGTETHTTASWDRRAPTRDEVIREVADVTRSTAAASSRIFSSVADTSMGRSSGMYFLNESTITILTWPLSSFSLTWPLSDVVVAADAEEAETKWEAAATTSAVPFTLGPATQNITIPVALVVRAHVLQATLCLRRAQHKRALECLAEARQWIAQQFSESGRSRTIRLLYEDLQERWIPSPTKEEAPSAGPFASTTSAMCVAASQLPPLPQFQLVMRNVIHEEWRACVAMVDTEECGVHYAILQACSTLPPPAPPLLSEHGSCVTAASASFECGSAPTHAHSPDIRLHYRRYHESVLQLHRVSQGYMQLLQGIEEEEEVWDKTQQRKTSKTKLRHSEREAVSYSRVVTALELRNVRTQVSPLCLCALSVAMEEDSSSSPQGSSTDRPLRRVYALGFDVRLAAEVLGWYHSLSFVYLLNQQAPSMQPSPISSNLSLSAATDESRTQMVVSRNGGGGGYPRPNGDTALIGETAFFQQYRHDSVYAALAGQSPHPLKREKHTATGIAVDKVTDDPADAPRDIISRAVEHFKVMALVFGQWGPASTGDPVAVSDSAPAALVSPSLRLSCTPESNFGSRRWRAIGPIADHGGSATHETVLLWCLAEGGLRENFPFLLHLSRTLGAMRSPLAAPSQVAAAHSKAIPPREAGSLQANWSSKTSAQQASASDDRAISPSLRKRSRSPSYRRGDSPLLEETQLRPPPSWSWVLPGVRRAAQLYVELMMVLMQAASTMSATTHPTAPPFPGDTGADVRCGAALVTPTRSSVAAPAVPVVTLGLHHAEQIASRLLFTVDAEMLQLSGNMWGSSDYTDAEGRNGGIASRGDPAGSRSRRVLVDQLYCSTSTQLRALVQIKGAALLTMARHHLTQLSVVRAVHYLREAQKFAWIFHRQAKLALLPEMHALLACVATCLSLRRVPKAPIREDGDRQRGADRATSRRCGPSIGDRESESPEEAAMRGQVEILLSFAQGWASTERIITARGGDGSGKVACEASERARSRRNPTLDGSTFAILPEEERAVARDVGLPYVHLLAAERASCTSLHTPPSFSLLLSLLKAWAVFQVVEGGADLVGHATEGDRHGQWVYEGGEEYRVPALPLSPVVPMALSSSSSSSPPTIPLPSPSHATTTLNTTIEDQQRRVARLDSVTTTPTSTPTLRSRHATLPAEMQRIQLEPAVVAATMKVEREKMEQLHGKDIDFECSVAAEKAGGTRGEAKERSGGEAPSRGGGRGSTALSPSPSTDEKSSPSSLAITIASPISRGECEAVVPLTQRHRARDVLQRMMAVLQHHYEMHGRPEATHSQCQWATGTVDGAGSTALPLSSMWTPQNTVLFQLLRSAVLLRVDRDEPGAVQQLKDITHYAKQHLGVLHPYVADGLALLTHAYTSLDVEEGIMQSSLGHDEVSSTDTSPSSLPSARQDQPSSSNAARTRRVAVQLAMRCSCTAFASLALGSAVSPPDEGWDGVETVTTPPVPLSVLETQLKGWWANQIERELLGLGGSGSGIAGASHQAQQLRLLLGWLPGCPTYCD